MALEATLGGQPPSLGALIGVLSISVLYTVYMVIFVAPGEEVGWRDYALPALRARYGALVSSAGLGYYGPCGTCRPSSTPTCPSSCN